MKAGEVKVCRYAKKIYRKTMVRFIASRGHYNPLERERVLVLSELRLTGLLTLCGARTTYRRSSIDQDRGS